MKISCPNCSAAYELDDARVPPSGLNIKCPKCKNPFTVHRPKGDAAKPAAKKAATAPKGRSRGRKSAEQSRRSPAAESKAAAAPRGASSGQVRIAEEAAPSGRKGRHDKHLVAGEPEIADPHSLETHHPEPARRPRSYRDLDSIPDDFD